MKLKQKSHYDRKIGLYFGSFNPIHIGHLVIANYMVEFTEIDKLWFVVTPHSPLKKKAGLLNDYDRLELVSRAIEEDERLQTCDIEFYLPKPSYTIDTLTYLTERNPTRRFKILIGSDNLKNFHKWKNYETIMENYGIIVYPRHGFDISKVQQHKNIMIAKDAPMMEISSSFIRKTIKKGRDMRYFLPLKVWEYIEKMGFYK